MKIIVSFDHPPIPARDYDFRAYDEDSIDVCGDPECPCRSRVLQGFGATEEEAIRNFVEEVLMKHDVSVSAIW